MAYPAVVFSQLPPSLRKDNNMTIKEEIDTRRRTCRYIDESCRLLKLPKIAAATAMVFVHRFYYAKHFRSNQHDRFEVAMAAVLLASKIEECPQKVDYVIAVCHDLRNRGVQAGNKLARSSSRTTRAEREADDNDDESLIKTTLKERVLLLERVILHTIGFELTIDHPYQFISEQIRRLVVVDNHQRIEFTPKSADQAMEVATLPTTRIREALMDQMKKWYGKGGGMHVF
jgi:Cyclin, N-terminal domain